MNERNPGEGVRLQANERKKVEDFRYVPGGQHSRATESVEKRRRNMCVNMPEWLGKGVRWEAGGSGGEGGAGSEGRGRLEV